MATLLPNEFQQYEFTPAELKSACIFSESNVQYIKTQLALAMLERANLTYNTEQPLTTFVQQEASLMGQIFAFRFLLDSHTSVISGLNSQTDFLE